jgi:hypothetical protein
MILSFLFDFPDFDSYSSVSFNSRIFKCERIITAELFEGVYNSYSFFMEAITELTELYSLSDKAIHGLQTPTPVCEV